MTVYAKYRRKKLIAHFKILASDFFVHVLTIVRTIKNRFLKDAIIANRNNDFVYIINKIR